MSSAPLIAGFPLRTAADLQAENVKIQVTGPPKTGKSSSIARAYTTYNEQKVITGYRIFYVVIGDATALDPLLIQTIDGKRVKTGVTPAHVLLDAKSLPKQYGNRISNAFWGIANWLTQYYASTPKDKRLWDAVAIDGINFLGAAINDEFEANGPRGWEKWSKIEEFFCSDLILWATGLGRGVPHSLEVFFIGHSSDPTFRDDGKVLTRGGALLPTKKISEQFPGKCDIVLRADSVKVPGVDVAERTLFTAPDPEWVAGDRFNLCAPREPLDMAEIIRRLHAAR